MNCRGFNFRVSSQLTHMTFVWRMIPFVRSNSGNLSAYPVDGRVGSTSRSLPRPSFFYQGPINPARGHIPPHHLLPGQLRSIPTAPTIDPHPQNDPDQSLHITCRTAYSRCSLILFLNMPS